MNIKDPDVYSMARRLSEITGKSMTEAVRQALRDRLDREDRRRSRDLLMERLLEISERCASRPVLDHRTDDEIIGYDEHGIPR